MPCAGVKATPLEWSPNAFGVPAGAPLGVCAPLALRPPATWKVNRRLERRLLLVVPAEPPAATDLAPVAGVCSRFPWVVVIGGWSALMR